MATVADLGAYLVTNVTAETLVAGTNLFYGRLPDAPDTCAAIFETGGAGPDDTFGANTVPVFSNPRVQVVARAAAYTDASTLADDIWTQLTKVANESLSGSAYQRVTPVQSPFPLDRDNQDRAVIACNYQISRTP